MRPFLKHICYLAALCLSVLSCKPCRNPQQTGCLPEIFPDYAGVTIPANIAPLDFEVSGAERLEMEISAPDGQSIKVRVPLADIPLKKWHRLTAAAKGDSLKFAVCALFEDGWKAYRPFGIYVSPDSIDYGLNYRLIAPGYELYSHMGIYERNLSNFEERPLIENTGFIGCVNCHSYCKGDPSFMSLHIRGDHGGTLIRSKGGELEACNTSTSETLGSCVYPYWHPGGRYIAYSTNTTRQAFHQSPDKLVEVFDLDSDLQVYDTHTNTLITAPSIKREGILETMPSFSPDGGRLYFTAAEHQPIPSGLTQVRYGLYYVDFHDGAIGSEIHEVVAPQEGSIAFPRPSYDGRFILYTKAAYGNFHAWHSSSDLMLLNLETGESRPLDEANSPDAESYHSWSNGSRWIVFGSRREDGLHTRLYISHIDPDGRCGKPFMLPQKNPRKYYDCHLRSYNVPEFVLRPVEFDRVKAEKIINRPERKAFSFRWSD